MLAGLRGSQTITLSQKRQNPALLTHGTDPWVDQAIQIHTINIVGDTKKEQSPVIVRMEGGGTTDAELDHEEEGIVGGADASMSIADGIDIDDSEILDLPTAHEEIRTFEEIKKEQLTKLEELKKAQHTKESEDKGTVIINILRTT